MNLEEILESQELNLALLVGNGVNRYVPASGTQSWDGLLGQLWFRHHNSSPSFDLRSVSLTEYYDMLDLSVNRAEAADSGAKAVVNLQKEFCELMKSWGPNHAHEKIVKRAKNKSIPLLTTNFERTFSSLELQSRHSTSPSLFQKYRLGPRGFTDYYPWSTYFSTRKINDPVSEFAVWHVNGMDLYPRSIRLGLSHYMGSVHRVRDWIHRGKSNRLFTGTNQKTWKGKDTWVQCIFSNDLLIFGLGLNRDEVFIRWLLVERARYFRKFPKRARKGWYVCNRSEQDDAKFGFLRSLNIEPVFVNDHSEIYEAF